MVRNGHGLFQSVSHLTDFLYFRNFLSVRGGVKGGSKFFIGFLGVSLKFELNLKKKLFENFSKSQDFIYRRMLLEVFK